MKKLMFAAVAALAMVGAANAAQSYGIDATGTAQSYEKDTNPCEENAGWYSCYVMKQEDAQAAMGCVGTAVSCSDMATWLGKNFVANKQSVIDNADSLSFANYQETVYGADYQFNKLGDSSSGLESAIGVFFYDDGANLAYNVKPNESGDMFEFNNSSAIGWQAVSVPEPTSGLLLLLGVAGLALKRKRA